MIPRLAGLAAATLTVTVLAVTVCPHNANPWPADLAVLTLYGVTVFLGIAQAGLEAAEESGLPSVVAVAVDQEDGSSLPATTRLPLKD